MRCRELLFEILDAILERLCVRIRRSRLAAAGRRAAGARSHESQVTGGCGTAGAAPRIHLTAHFADRLGLIQRGNLIRAREAQYGAAPQNIDISAERVGIGAEHGHHGLIDVGRRDGARIRAQAARNLDKRVALGHPVTAADDRRCPRLRSAAGRGGPGCATGGWRSRNGCRCGSSGRGGNGRCGHRGCATCRLTRRIHRRVQQ